MSTTTFDPKTLERLQRLSPEDLLRWVNETFGTRAVFASSFGAEDVVVLEMISRVARGIRIITLDTGRLHEETYDVMERIRRRYDLRIEVYFPDRHRVEELLRSEGFYSFRKSIEARKACCRIRKVEPLERALEGASAWITGLRRQQSVTRTRLATVEVDEAHGGILKLNPLADWSWEQVWDYIRSRDIPYNLLHDRGFPSIGCAPCTRAVAPGEDLRAGRWWWESPEHKECGLHVGKSATAEGDGKD
jgi:phosphoadenosine phosphosulfate reductase